MSRVAPASSPQENAVHSEVPVSASVSHARQATPEEIAAEADEIFKEVTAAKLRDEDVEGQEALLKRVQDDHKDFNATFPLVVRWTAQTQQYKRSAMLRYIAYMRGRSWATRRDYLTDQGEYLVILYKEMKTHYNVQQLNEYRQSIVKQLLKEDDEFEEMKKEAEKELKKKKEAIDGERRRALYAFLLRQKVEAEAKAAIAAAACGPV